jgi:tetratricopeptide (TPR) repeat protein
MRGIDPMRKRIEKERDMIGALRIASSLAGLGLVLLLAGCAASAPQRPSPDVVAKRLSLAQLYMDAQKYPQAVTLLTELSKADPKNAEIHYNLGVALFGSREYEGAEASLKEAVRLDPRRTDAGYYLGATYYARHKNDLALQEFRRVFEDPSSTVRDQAYLSTAILYDDMGNVEEAMRNAQLAIEANPKFYPAHYELAVLLDRLDRIREALEEYEIAAPDYASDPNYHYRVGVAYFRDRRYDRAREHLVKVTEAVPGTEKAKKAREFLDLIAAGKSAQPTPGHEGR